MNESEIAENPSTTIVNSELNSIEQTGFYNLLINFSFFLCTIIYFIIIYS